MLCLKRDRPDLIADGIAAPGLHSFPSGHALVIFTVYGFIAVLWWRAAHSAVEKGVAIATFIVWLSLVSTARLVLGAHWLTDILASYLIGLAWLIVLILALRQAETVTK